MNKNFVTLSIALCALLVVGLACGGSSSSSDAKPVGPEFVGAWRANDGSTITIRSDSSADYKIGGTSVSGGKAEVSEKDKTLKIGLLGMGSPMKLDKSPANGEMTVDGVVYKREGGSTSTSSSPNKPDNDGAPNEVPPAAEVEKIVGDALEDFTDGIEDGNLTEFYKNASAPWRQNYTLKETDETFKSFYENKDKVLPSLKNATELSPQFDKPAKLDTDNDFKRLSVEGKYNSKPFPVKFVMEFYWTDGRWGFKRFKVDM